MATGGPARDRAESIGLVASSLAAFRGERLILRDLSFTVLPGGALVLAGANGSGKSTLLRLLAGLLRPVAGSLFWRGQDVFVDLTAHGRRIAYLGHQDAIKPGLTAAENLRLAERLSGKSAAAALDRMGLGTLADLPARMLSAGQRRRLSLARLCLGDAPIWLLDEPTLGLDMASLDRFGAMLADHRDAGGVVVAATHVPLPLPGAAELQLS